MVLGSRLSIVIAAALVLAGCGARAKPAAAPTEAEYDWSGFNGGKAAPEPTAKTEKPEKAPAKEEKTEKVDKQEPKEAAKEPPKDTADEAPKEPSKKVSATKIAGMSLSEVTPDSAASASQRATKKNVVSTNVIVGAEYEQINIVLEKMAVQIVRPATSPDKSGPKVRSPKARKNGVAQTEAAYYDASADVLVLVQASDKATSKKALSALVSGGAPPAKKSAKPAKPKRA